ncbi:MAG: cyclic nucleotide-binding domain-containing protein [Kofleriaceae bacterium]
MLARDPSWAVALIRARHAELDPARRAAILQAASTDPARRAGALTAIARGGPAATLPILETALVDGDPGAIAAIAELDAGGADHLVRSLPVLSPLARLAIARALAGATSVTHVVGALVADNDSEVAHAALRTALAIARGGGTIPAAPIAAAHEKALAALHVHLDKRDDLAQPSEHARLWSPWARHELDLATRGCVARLMWASAVEVAAAGGDPATLAATARRLLGAREPDRRRALDVIQELQSGRPEILGVLESWLGNPNARLQTKSMIHAVDPWLNRLASGELAALEPSLVALRTAALFATVPGPALASLAVRATLRTVTGELFAADSAGDTMYVVVAGALIAHRTPGEPRRVEPGGVVGELAVLTQAPRAASVMADGSAEVLEIDRATFAAASRRTPELVLGLAATLAGWIAPDRPDVL